MNRAIADPIKRSDKKGRLKSGDLFIVCLVFLSAVVLLLCGRHSETAAHVAVTVGSSPAQTLPLDQDGTYSIDGHLTVCIENGTVRIENADCPDRHCVRMGTIHQTGQVLVCLPNQIVVRIVGAEKMEVDTVVY